MRAHQDALEDKNADESPLTVTLRAVLIPLGARSARWLTALTVAHCRRKLEARSAFFGIQAYATNTPTDNVPLRLRVWSRSWWLMYPQAELVVDLEPNGSSTLRTAVSVAAVLRVGVAISLVVWIAILLVPLLAFSSVPTRTFFAVMLLLPLVSVLITTRLQIRSGLRQLRVALPEVYGAADSSVGGGGATVC